MRDNYHGRLLLLVCVLSLFASGVATSPVVLWSQRSHIWTKLRGIRDDFGSWISNGSRPRDMVQSRTVTYGVFSALGYDPVTDDLYWNDKAQNTIYRQSRTETFKAAGDLVTTIFTTGKQSEIDGLAVDWLTAMVYFADGGKRQIAVVASGSRTTGMHRVLFHTDLGDPKGITLDPHEGLLFWADPVKRRIERSTLAGTERQVIVSGPTTTSPRAVTADLRETRLYWVDDSLGTIESASYSGTERTVHFDGGVGRTYVGLATSTDYIFVATDMLLILDVHDKINGSRIAKRDIDAIINDVIVLEPREPESHECDDKECEQLCLNIGQGKGVCECAEGYYIDIDGTSCIESKPRYIYSVGDALLSADVTIEDRVPRLVNERRVIDNMNKVQALGFHFERHLLYFSDTNRGVIYSGDPDVGKWTEHTVGTRQVEGISIDWLSGNVYWTDATLGHIMISQLDGRHHRILLSDIGQPRGVAVDPFNRWLFWSDRAAGEIHRSRLDGSRDITLIADDVTSPQGLVVDSRMKRLYWVNTDATKLEYTDLDGKNRAVAITATGGGVLYDVTVFQEYATWTEENSGIHVGSGTTGEVLTNGVFTNFSVTQSYDVVTYDTYLQPTTTSACRDTDCEQLCFPVATGYTCGCAIGFTLNADEKSCDSDVTDRFFLLFPDPYHKQIYQLQTMPASARPHGVKLPRADHPVSVDYDRALAVFYWLDRGTGQIKSSSGHGTHETVLLEVTEDMYPERISVDPYTKFLYYTDSKIGAIFRIALYADAREPELIVSGLSKPFAIFVDYDNGLLYWSSMAPTGTIEVSKLDGTERRVVVKDLLEPTGIALLDGGEMLYYGDRQQRRIVAVNVTTGDGDIIFNGTDEEIYSLAASGKYVYFTAWNKKAVFQLDISNLTNITMASEPIFARLTDIRAFDERLPLALIDPSSGINIFILVGLLLVGLLLLFLILLAALFINRRCRRKPKQSEDGNDTATTSANSDSIGEDWAGLETIDHDMFEPIPFASPAAASTLHETPPVTYYENVPDVFRDTFSGHAPPIADTALLGAAVMLPVVAAAVDDGESDSVNSVVSDDYPEVFSDNDDSLAIPIPLIIGVGDDKSKNKAAVPNPDSVTESGPKESNLDGRFDLPADARMATVIQRIVGRLRGGLSSIRWNNAERPTSGTKHHGGGRTAKDLANRRLYENQSTPGTSARAKQNPKSAASKGGYPAALHKEPRGFAPASHCVPRSFKMSWGRNAQRPT